ncbi:MAG: DNA-processing protein DprA [Spirochaetales bacterium]|nr:DNA-processing protein DprA [Spirochaetales bacterium]
MNQDELFFLLAIHRTPRLRPREKMLLLEMAGSAVDAWDLIGPGLSSLILRPFFIDQAEKEEAESRARDDIKYIQKGHTGCLFLWDADYPPQLREIYDPPFLLFYRGRLPDFTIPCIGVVGTRRPTGAAREMAYRIGIDIASAGFPVVSGLARGIDSEAHMGTLRAYGRAIAVLGNGIDSVYPRSNVKLAEKILENGGVLVSEYPPDTPPRKHHFPARNRIISGLSRSLVIVQAPLSSGALITAHYALEQGRDIYVHSVGTGGNNSFGSEGLTRSGARIITSVNDILDDWGWETRKSKSAETVFNAGEPGARLANMLEWELKEELIPDTLKINRIGEYS